MARWKREVVEEHKFDYVDVNEFYDPSCFTKIKYFFVFVVFIKSCLVYAADVQTAVFLLLRDRLFSGFDDLNKDRAKFDIFKWVYFGCIIFSFLLLTYDVYRARAIIASRDIAFSFTSTITYRFYVLRSYAYYCFFSRIHESKTRSDEVAFFVFFTLKGWKRLFIAEGPRQGIACYILFTLFKKYYDNPEVKALSPQQLLVGFWNGYNNNGTANGLQTGAQRFSVILMSFTLIIWIFTCVHVTIALVIYPFLLCKIRGNLKEYCCHKIDKRIGELLKKRLRKRMIEMEKMREYQSRNGARSPLDGPMPQATLPDIEKVLNPENQSYALSPNAHLMRQGTVLSEASRVHMQSPLPMSPPLAPYGVKGRYPQRQNTGWSDAQSVWSDGARSYASEARKPKNIRDLNAQQAMLTGLDAKSNLPPAADWGGKIEHPAYSPEPPRHHSPSPPLAPYSPPTAHSHPDGSAEYHRSIARSDGSIDSQSSSAPLYSHHHPQPMPSNYPPREQPQYQPTYSPPEENGSQSHLVSPTLRHAAVTTPEYAPQYETDEFQWQQRDRQAHAQPQFAHPQQYEPEYSRNPPHEYEHPPSQRQYSRDPQGYPPEFGQNRPANYRQGHF
ncbi:uncharacterized protein VTP21DRAFT_5949 [Calcarisporiella thermophila]|uniref:uncharacterized protein n=1 Tax=Calcarisporiella thermophila TaxID=911321 RepID=UPI003744720E